MVTIHKTVALIALLGVVLPCGRGFAAGGVVGEAGSCMIEIGFYTAHFSIFQPQKSANEVFCEDLPDAGKTVFILDYLHASLKEVPVDFRIIRDDQEFGQFVRWENITQIRDLDAQTVFFKPGEIYPDERMNVEHTFAESGQFIGIVTAPHPSKNIMYRAVFPFEVGNTGYGYWPIIILLGLVLQIQFMLGDSWFKTARDKLGIARS
ncbi:MAG: hypothetical protein ABGY96_15480 [bacterium]|nr:hypothetical protein [Gammaproteobacteria bacterium]HIL96693.1 hypothetical protein [Pseudomonadales bacterium]